MSRSSRARVSEAARHATYPSSTVAAYCDLIRSIALDVEQMLICDERVDQGGREGLLDNEPIVDGEDAVVARHIDQAEADARVEILFVRRAEPVRAYSVSIVAHSSADAPPCSVMTTRWCATGLLGGSRG